MKRLCTREVKHFAEYLGFTEADAQEITDLFFKIKSVEPDGRKIGNDLNNVDEYIWEWDNHWYRESNWKEYYEHEKNNNMYCYGDTDEEAEEIFESLESFKKAVSDETYELSSGMIIVVC